MSIFIHADKYLQRHYASIAMNSKVFLRMYVVRRIIVYQCNRQCVLLNDNTLMQADSNTKRWYSPKHSQIRRDQIIRSSNGTIKYNVKSVIIYTKKYNCIFYLALCPTYCQDKQKYHRESTSVTEHRLWNVEN